MCVRLFSDIGHVMTKNDLEGICTSSRQKLKCTFTLLGDVRKGKAVPQFINVIAPNNNLLMDELNVIYFAPKWWLYIMIWLPRTTDNSIYFAQPLEIRGI